ncbi:MAG: SpoIIE family protein phosphatase [Ruminiclostridium sp.]|nr:SpoIIE family protein phosphatase [Ruminiclostridium sp.]
MVEHSNVSNPVDGFVWNSPTLLTIGLIIVAILVIMVLLVIRDRRKRASTEVEGVQLFDEKKRKRKKRMQPEKQAEVKLFSEEDGTTAEGQTQPEAGQPEAGTQRKRQNVQRTVRLYDEKAKPPKGTPKQHDEIQLFDDLPHNASEPEEQPVTVKLADPDSQSPSVSTEQPVTIGITVSDKADKIQKTSAIPTTLELFATDEQFETCSIGNAQHIGKREDQQDSFGVSDVFNREEVSRKGILAVLADGMGGLENGAECSKSVVAQMLDAFTRMDIQADIAQGLRTIVENINVNIYSEFNQENTQSMTGSTLVAAVLKGNLLYWISVGDSRVYLFRDNGLTQLNKEHNYGTRLDENAQQGFISVDEAQNDPNRAALTSYIGIDELTEIDRNLEPIQLQPGDRVVMCSDGLFSTLSVDEITQALINSPQEAAQEMVDQVVQKDRMYQDNVTVIVLGI